jgi:hypothetical protein
MYVPTVNAHFQRYFPHAILFAQLLSAAGIARPTDNSICPWNQFKYLFAKLSVVFATLSSQRPPKNPELVMCQIAIGSFKVAFLQLFPASDWTDYMHMVHDHQLGCQIQLRKRGLSLGTYSTSLRLSSVSSPRYTRLCLPTADGTYGQARRQDRS